MAYVGPVEPHYCLKCNKESYLITTSDDFYIYRCDNCNIEYSIKRNNMKFVVIRDDNNKILTSIEQAVHVAEKLAAENPSHKYYIAKLIKESKCQNVITVDLE